MAACACLRTGDLFDGGAITSDGGALLLGATDRAITLVDRFAACFIDRRDPRLVEHLVRTLVGQRVFGIALGYEDLSDHDELRHDPVMAVIPVAHSSWMGLRPDTNGRPCDSDAVRTCIRESRSSPSRR